MTRSIVPILSPLLRRTGVPSTLSLAIRCAVSRTITSGPTAALVTSSSYPPLNKSIAFLSSSLFSQFNEGQRHIFKDYNGLLLPLIDLRICYLGKRRRV